MSRSANTRSMPSRDFFLPGHVMSPVNGYSAEAPAVISIVDQFEGTSGPGPASTLLPATTVPGGTSSVSSPVTNPSATSPPASIAPAAAPSGAVPNFGLAVVSVNVQSGWATFESDSSGNRQDVRYEACPRYFTSTQNGDAGLTALHPGDFVGLEIDAMTPAHCMVNATVWAAPKWPACQATGPGSVVRAIWVTANPAVQSVVYTPVGQSQPTVVNHWCRPPLVSTLLGSPTGVARHPTGGHGPDHPFRQPVGDGRPCRPIAGGHKHCGALARSGPFYWAKTRSSQPFWAANDCTDRGASGATLKKPWQPPAQMCSSA